MIKKLISWLIELFRKKPRKQKELEDKIEDLENKLEDIDESINTPSDNVDYLNK